MRRAIDCTRAETSGSQLLQDAKWRVSFGRLRGECASGQIKYEASDAGAFDVWRYLGYQRAN